MIARYGAGGGLGAEPASSVLLSTSAGQPNYTRGSRRGGLPIMTGSWSLEELDNIGTAGELQIAGRRADETLRHWVPIWVVCVGEQVYVRTWYRHESGWFGHVRESRRARIRVPGVEVNVTVEDIGEGTAELRAGVDTAYRTKYGRYGSASVEQMVSAAAAATTLRLTREEGQQGG
ncbi:DUF2255 family protein [Streptomyces sp. NPDC096311]|uniref:DUF2255 family protein n=1 Tax=Streptomyces sp. NPDC096311 TaxID=3366083 RepID=UPI00381E74B0